MLKRSYLRRRAACLPGPPYLTYGLRVPEAQGILPRFGTTVRTPYAYHRPGACRTYRVPCGAPQVVGAFDCVAEFEADNFGVAEYANANGLGLRVGPKLGPPPPPADAVTPLGESAAAVDSSGQGDRGLPTMQDGTRDGGMGGHGPGSRQGLPNKGLPAMVKYAWDAPEDEAEP